MLDHRTDTHPHAKSATGRCPDRTALNERREAARRSAEKWVRKRRKTRTGAPCKVSRFVGLAGAV